ncbi:hypothetical protein [Bradyrhizobium tunisiense]|uniref:hypothetical protein n=1 Tax=Bradyrhizobium tunisiense TaxID=3278709 RepID=UPI0035D76710
MSGQTRRGLAHEIKVAVAVCVEDCASLATEDRQREWLVEQHRPRVAAGIALDAAACSLALLTSRRQPRHDQASMFNQALLLRRLRKAGERTQNVGGSHEAPEKHEC